MFAGLKLGNSTNNETTFRTGNRSTYTVKVVADSFVGGITPDAEVQVALLLENSAAVLATLNANSDMEPNNTCLASAVSIGDVSYTKASREAITKGDCTEVDNFAEAPQIVAVWLCPLNFDLHLDKVVLQNQHSSSVPLVFKNVRYNFDDPVAEGVTIQMRPTNEAQARSQTHRV